MTTFYDLSIPWLHSTQSSAATRRSDATLQSTHMLCHLGYSICAYNVHLEANQVSPAMLKAASPCPGLIPPFPELDPRCKESVKSNDKILQLSRLTVRLDEAACGGKGNGGGFNSSNANHLAQYDLLAAMPTDNASLHHICTSLVQPGNTSIDIISLDFASSPKLPFQLRRGLVLGALKQGVVFEVCYGVIMRSSAAVQPDQQTTAYRYPDTLQTKDARRNLFAHTRALAEVTKGGKGIIFSSSAIALMELRAPGEIINLLQMLGFTKESSKAAIEGTAKRAVMRGWSARRSWRGVVAGPDISPVLVQDTQATQSAEKGRGKRKADDSLEAGAKRKKRRKSRSDRVLTEAERALVDVELLPTQPDEDDEQTADS